MRRSGRATGTYYIAVERASLPAAPAAAPAGEEEGGDAGPGSGGGGAPGGGSDGGSEPGTSPHPPGEDGGHGGNPGAGCHESGGAGGSEPPGAAGAEAEAGGGGQDVDMAPADGPPADGDKPQTGTQAEPEAGTSQATEQDAATAKQDATTERASAEERGTTAQKEGAGEEVAAAKDNTAGPGAAGEPASQALAATTAAATAEAPVDAMDVDRPAAAEAAPAKQQEDAGPSTARPQPRTTRGRASAAAAAAAAATAAAVKAAKAPEAPALRTRQKTEPPPAPAAGKGKGEQRADSGKGKDGAVRAESAEAPAPAADAAVVEAQEPTWQDLFLRAAQEAVAAREGEEPLPEPRHDTVEVVGRLLTGGCEDFRCGRGGGSGAGVCSRCVGACLPHTPSAHLMPLWLVLRSPSAWTHTRLCIAAPCATSQQPCPNHHASRPSARSLSPPLHAAAVWWPPPLTWSWRSCWRRSSARRRRPPAAKSALWRWRRLCVLNKAGEMGCREGGCRVAGTPPRYLVRVQLAERSWKATLRPAVVTMVRALPFRGVDGAEVRASEWSSSAQSHVRMYRPLCQAAAACAVTSGHEGTGTEVRKSHTLTSVCGSVGDRLGQHEPTVWACCVGIRGGTACVAWAAHSSTRGNDRARLRSARASKCAHRMGACKEASLGDTLTPSTVAGATRHQNPTPA